jgi:sugar lactone lactonase YvrE
VGVAGLAFDANGRLWGTATREVFRLDAAQLLASGAPHQTILFTLSMPGGLTFDATGALWISNEDKTIVRYVPGTTGDGSNFNTSDDLFYPNWPVLYPKP